MMIPQTVEHSYFRQPSNWNTTGPHELKCTFQSASVNENSSPSVPEVQTSFQFVSAIRLNTYNCQPLLPERTTAAVLSVKSLKSVKWGSCLSTVTTTGCGFPSGPELATV